MEIKKTSPATKYRPYFPGGGFGPDILAFSTAVIDLQEKRHLADYNPEPRFKTSDVILAVSTGRSGVQRFQAATEEQRKTFLSLLVCPPR